MRQAFHFCDAEIREALIEKVRLEIGDHSNEKQFDVTLTRHEADRNMGCYFSATVTEKQ